jgi:hypothetical protein
MSDFHARYRPISALLRWTPPLIVAAAFMHCLMWLAQVGGLLVDTGRELQLPQRMLAGEAYSDLPHYIFVPYVNMLWRDQCVWRCSLGQRLRHSCVWDSTGFHRAS